MERRSVAHAPIGRWSPAPIKVPEMERRSVQCHHAELPVVGPHNSHTPHVHFSHATEKFDGGELLGAGVQPAPGDTRRPRPHRRSPSRCTHWNACHGLRRRASATRLHGLPEFGVGVDGPCPRTRVEDTKARSVHAVCDMEYLEGEADASVVGDQSSAKERDLVKAQQ